MICVEYTHGVRAVYKDPQSRRVLVLHKNKDSVWRWSWYNSRAEELLRGLTHTNKGSVILGVGGTEA